MSESNTPTTYLSDYTVPAFSVESVELTFKLFEEGASVFSSMVISRSSESKAANLTLDGEELELKSLKLDGEQLATSRYDIDAETLVIKDVPATFTLECETWIKPQDNKRLEGLYKSASMFCTQCEAQGFRRITYYLDRPDVMSVFQTRIEADKSRYPILLSNGNPVDSGELADGRHFVTWQDPFPKPCYLFALVAGDLYQQQTMFETCSGRQVALRIFVDHKNSDKCDYALDCLARAMTWDEQVYGREYDLDIFMIVAVDDFNMGAMENKGLNIFNSSCVLANPAVTTDAAYQNIEAIVAHEYFHNWSGNRVTCRDWFQLSLKEGFTVFRDAEFSADMNSKVVKRIDDVNMLRTAQFAEDAGPMSHPIRPASYMEISNFYTLTVYEKGAEVVRMLHTLLGAHQFRAGSDLYFDRHDGEAVTTDDFVAAMEDVSGQDLSQFRRWYDQSGTPEVQVVSNFDAEQKRYTLSFSQSCPPTPGQESKKAFHIPVALGLLDSQGNDLPLAAANGETTWVFELTESSETVVFEDIDAEPVPSLLRHFSAPVKLFYDYSDAQLLFLMANDSDGFSRWDAGQTLAVRVLQRLIKAFQNGEMLTISESFIGAFRSILRDQSLDKAMVCKLLMLPAESYLIELSDIADVDAIHHAREFVRSTLATALSEDLYRVYQENVSDDAALSLDFGAMSQRALKNSVLMLLSACSSDKVISLAKTQFNSAQNMTDRSAAMIALVNSGDREAADVTLGEFYKTWGHDAQVLEQWFAIQAGSAVYSDLSQIHKLIRLSDFDLSNPNKVRSVIGVYCNQNLLGFHDRSGNGYAFLADYVAQLDDINPQIASRLIIPLTRWRKYDSGRQTMMLEQLRRIHGKDKLSKDVRELVEKSLP